MPVARRAQRQVGATPIPGERLSAAATALSEGAGVEAAREEKFGQLAQVGARATSFGLELHGRQQAERRREAEEARERANQIAVLEATNQIIGFERDTLYDPERGLMNKLGKDAQGIPEEYDAAFAAFSGEVGKGLSNDEQKLAFAKVLAQRRESGALSTRRHAANEAQKHAANVAKETIENSIDMAVREGTADPGKARVHMRAAEDVIRKTAAQFGLADVDVENQIRAFHTQTHEGIIRNLLAQDKASAARSYFNEAKDDIAAERHDDLKGLLKEGTTRKQAQVETARIAAEGGTLDEQRAKAKQIDDADVQDDVLRRLEHEHDVTKARERDEERVFLRDVANTLERTRNFDALGTATIYQLDPGQRAAFRNYVEELTRRKDITTDPRTLYKHLTDAGNDPTKWAAEVVLERDLANLSKADMEQLLSLRASILNGDRRKAESALNGYLTPKQIVDQTLKSGGFDTNPPKNSKAEARYNAFQMDVHRQVEALQARTGKQATDQDIQKIADALIRVEVSEPSRIPFVGPTTRTLQELTFADISPKDRTDIAAELRKLGKAVTDAEILRIYRVGRVRESVGR